MPKMNGVQVLQKIRNFCKEYNETQPDIKIEEPTYVFLTAYASQAFKAYLRDLGVEMIFEKPLRKEILSQILEKCKVQEQCV